MLLIKTASKHRKINRTQKFNTVLQVLDADRQTVDHRIASLL